MKGIMKILNFKLFVYGLITLSVLASSPSTLLKTAQANTCSTDTRPTFLKEIPSLAWYTFDNKPFESIDSVQSEIFSNPLYFQIINSSINQFLSENDDIESLDTTNESTPQTLYVFKYSNNPNLGFISRNRTLIENKIDQYIEEIVKPSVRYIENEYEQLFFNESPVNRAFYFAYSNQFNTSFYGGCYVSATTTNPTFNFESQIQQNSLPNYPLENGYYYDIVIKTSSNGVVLDQYTVFVRTSLIPPSFTINQTNLLSLVNNDQAPKLSFTENISLTYSLPVPEALIVIVNLNKFNDEGRFIHLTTSGNQSTLSGTIDLDENQHFELTLFYLDYSKDSPITRRKYQIYTSSGDFSNSWFSIDPTTSDYLTNPNYQRSIFDYYVDNHQREFTLWINQKPDQVVKHEGFLLRSFSIQRQNVLLLEDDFGKLITNDSNTYRFVKNGAYSISYRYNNKPTAQVSQSINFSTLDTHELNLVNSENSVIKKLTTQTVEPKGNFINSTNLVLTLKHTGLIDNRRIPLNLTISNDQGDVKSITSSSTKDIFLNSELQLLKPFDQRTFNYTISLVDPNASITYVYVIKYQSIFDCVRFSQTYESNTQDTLSQFKNVTGNGNTNNVCSTSEKNIIYPEALDSSTNIYLLVPADIFNIRMKNDIDKTWISVESLQSDPNDPLKIYRIDLPDGRALTSQTTITIEFTDKYGNILMVHFSLKPELSVLSFSDTSLLLVIISLLAVLLSPIVTSLRIPKK
jgi:hypothetical protein